MINDYLKATGLERFCDLEALKHSQLKDEIPAVNFHLHNILAEGKVDQKTRLLLMHMEFEGMYDGYKLYYTLKLALRHEKGDTRFELGMKYPCFALAHLEKEFGIEQKWENIVLHESLVLSPPLSYDIYKSANGAIFAFEPNRESGGYFGAIFPNSDEAIRFLDWYREHPEFETKNTNIGYNGMNGLNCETWDKFRA